MIASAAALWHVTGMFFMWPSLCVLLATIFAFEQHYHPDRGSAAMPIEWKLVMFGFLGLAIAGQVETFRGFLIIWLCSVGAYRVTKLTLDWFLHLIGFRYLWQRDRS